MHDIVRVATRWLLMLCGLSSVIPTTGWPDGATPSPAFASRNADIEEVIKRRCDTQITESSLRSFVSDVVLNEIEADWSHFAESSATVFGNITDEFIARIKKTSPTENWEDWLAGQRNYLERKSTLTPEMRNIVATIGRKPPPQFDDREAVLTQVIEDAAKSTGVQNPQAIQFVAKDINSKIALCWSDLQGYTESEFESSTKNYVSVLYGMARKKGNFDGSIDEYFVAKNTFKNENGYPDHSYSANSDTAFNWYFRFDESVFSPRVKGFILVTSVVGGKRFAVYSMEPGAGERPIWEGSTQPTSGKECVPQAVNQGNYAVECWRSQNQIPTVLGCQVRRANGFARPARVDFPF